MIIPMQKVTVLCLESDRDTTLETLADLRVIHLIPMQPPSSEDVDQLRLSLSTVEKALHALPPVDKKHLSNQTKLMPNHELEAAIPDILSLHQQKSELEEEMELLRFESERLMPLGDFDPESIRLLEQKGLTVILASTPAKGDILAPKGVIVKTLYSDKNIRYVALIGQGIIEHSLQEFSLPKRSLREVCEALAEAERDHQRIENELRASSEIRPSLEELSVSLKDQLRFAETRASMGQSHSVAYLKGFCPERDIPALRQAAECQGWGLLLQAPEAHDATVPTLIENPRWIKPIKALFDMLGILPGYREIDPSAVFLVFFSIFFAMLVGDAGYGLLFIGLTYLMHRHWKKVPRNTIPLLAILSGSTIVWGVMTGSYFGIQTLPAPLRQLKIDWLSHEANIESLCFLLGTIHLSVAHGWNAIRTFPSGISIAQAGWIGLAWTMYFMACYFVLAQPLPSYIGWLFGISVAAIALFMTPPAKLKQEWSNHIILPLTVIGNFGDIVSYLRLYLVGSASVTLIMAFTELAVGKGMSTWYAGLAAALIIFAAHVLNILLSALAVLVHGVRLNALEFSTHLGLQWAGIRFIPFARQRAADIQS